MTKIDVQALPCPGPMADSKLQADHVGVLDVQRTALQLKGELIEPERDSTSKRPEPFRPFSHKGDVDARIDTKMAPALQSAYLTSPILKVDAGASEMNNPFAWLVIFV